MLTKISDSKHQPCCLTAEDAKCSLFSSLIAPRRHQWILIWRCSRAQPPGHVFVRSSELEKRLMDPTPRPETTPGEVIETVLMALRSDQDDQSSVFNGAPVPQHVISRFLRASRAGWGRRQGHGGRAVGSHYNLGATSSCHSFRGSPLRFHCK